MLSTLGTLITGAGLSAKKPFAIPSAITARISFSITVIPWAVSFMLKRNR